MKRVLYIAPRFHTNQFYPVKFLVKNGVEVKFVSQYSHKIENYADLTPIIMGYNPFFNFVFKNFRSEKGRMAFFVRYGFPPIIKTIKMIKEFKPDLIIIREYFSVYSLVGAGIAKLLKIKYIIYTQTPKYDKNRILKGKKDKIVCFFKRLLISKYEMTPIIGEKDAKSVYCNEDFIFYVPLVIEKNLYLDQKKQIDDGTISLIIISEFQKRKRILEFLDIYNKLLTNGNKLYLTIIGNADKEHTKMYLKEVINYIENHNLGDNIQIKTDIPHEQVMREYIKHDIFILPSFMESAGYSVLEAMSSKMPVICSTGSGLKEYIRHGENGYIYDENNFIELYSYLERLIKCPELIKTFGKKSLELVENNYNSKKYYEGLTSIWCRLNNL